MKFLPSHHWLMALFAVIAISPGLAVMAQDEASFDDIVGEPRKTTERWDDETLLERLVPGREVPAGLFQRKKKRGWFSFGKPKPVIQMLKPPSRGRTVPIHVIRGQAENIARLGLPYKFGGCTPGDGGMDCSGSVQFLLKSVGYRNVPRTSYAQYEWIEEESRIKRDREIDPGKIRPGDLLFWGGTYDSGHKVSHAMLYMGQSPDGKIYAFGARSSRMKGVSGAGVDIFEMRPGKKKTIWYGSLPPVGDS